MADLVRDSLNHVDIRDRALEIVRGFYATSKMAAVRAIVEFVRRSVTVIDEPEEVLIHPLRMLRDIDAGRAYGDCDDIAMLTAALLAGIGVPVRFKAVFPSETGYRHVFTEFDIGIGWRPADATISGLPVYPPDWLTEGI